MAGRVQFPSERSSYARLMIIVIDDCEYVLRFYCCRIFLYYTNLQRFIIKNIYIINYICIFPIYYSMYYKIMRNFYKVLRTE